MTEKKQESILIVNGEPDTADLFAGMLLMVDDTYIVTTAFTAKECLAGIKKNSPDVVLMDMDLPDMDGWDLIEKIKKNHPDIPIVVSTSKIPVISDMFRLSMVSDYLIKPVTLDCLHMAVRDAIEIPSYLDQCVKTIKYHKEKEDILYLLFLLLKQNITDRKRFILMRQLYPDHKLENDPQGKKLLNNLKEKINSVQTEIKNFKNDRFLLA
ncbi:MAG: response regulator [Candidatus Methanoperedens sp.]|nr:response regulator [Candidatus Methanoperedens sp.]